MGRYSAIFGAAGGVFHWGAMYPSRINVIISLKGSPLEDKTIVPLPVIRA
jgi:hypothetical protein